MLGVYCDQILGWYHIHKRNYGYSRKCNQKGYKTCVRLKYGLSHYGKWQNGLYLYRYIYSAFLYLQVGKINKYIKLENC